LPLERYASNPSARFKQLSDTQTALRDVLGHRLYRDLERGWRVTSPNLEQCGLLKISYDSLEEVCEAEGVWQENHAALAGATPETRAKVATVLLDDMRRRLAIKVGYLDYDYQERTRRRSNQNLIPPWAVDENEEMNYAAILFPAPSAPTIPGTTPTSPRVAASASTSAAPPPSRSTPTDSTWRRQRRSSAASSTASP